MRHEYIEAMKLGDVPFYALIMAAMKRADTSNLDKLQSAWPDVWSELFARYHAPDGILTGSDADRFGE